METIAPPAGISDLRVSPAQTPVFFWTNGSNRRIVVSDWAQLKVLGQRVFRRFRGGSAHWRNLQATLHKLDVPGRPSAAIFKPHVVGYVRPWALEDQNFEAGSKPAMLAKASRRGFYLISPVLVPSVEYGRKLLRHLRDEYGEVPTKWQCYQGELPEQPMDKLFMAGSAGLRTELEHELTQSFGPAGKARQAFELPPAAIAN